MPTDAQIQVEADDGALTWLAAHRPDEPRVIAYDVKRCCGGGKICRVQVRERSSRDDRDAYVRASREDGTEILIDRRAAARLPSRLKLTVRGRGRRQHLDLELEPEQWGTLLYT